MGNLGSSRTIVARATALRNIQIFLPKSVFNPVELSNLIQGSNLREKFAFPAEKLVKKFINPNPNKFKLFQWCNTKQEFIKEVEYAYILAAAVR